MTDKAKQEKKSAAKEVLYAGETGKTLAERVLVEPVLSEKASAAAAKNAFVFRVAPHASKTSIRAAVEELYGVSVEKITTINRSGKVRRRGRIVGKTKSQRRAFVRIKKGEKIDVFKSEK